MVTPLSATEFLRLDSRLAPYAQDFTVPEFPVTPQPFRHLVEAILGQQLSGKAAAAITHRLFTHLGGEDRVTPENLVETSVEDLRACGASRAKANTILDLSRHVISGALPLPIIHTLPDEDVEHILTKVKGIGPWSAHMFLMFGLNRKDVWPIGDLGVRKGLQVILGLESLPDPKEVATMCEMWRPYRSSVAHLAWHVLDRKKEETSKLP
ncbi:MAG: hypothetical protein MUC92_08590 [Fimbriimonadaceae bacterium]|jgi:DNA-3-methyladenine glycosylase II|nr:hypothetical protein [Fimbriimonadaceae bacterium]